MLTALTFQFAVCSTAQLDNFSLKTFLAISSTMIAKTSALLAIVASSALVSTAQGYGYNDYSSYGGYDGYGGYGGVSNYNSCYGNDYYGSDYAYGKEMKKHHGHRKSYDDYGSYGKKYGGYGNYRGYGDYDSYGKVYYDGHNSYYSY